MVRPLVLAVILLASVARGGEAQASGPRLDPALLARAQDPRGLSRVIVQTTDPGATLSAVLDAGGFPGIALANGFAAEVPDAALAALGSRPEVIAVGTDRPVHDTLDQAAAMAGARWVGDTLGYDGTGIGIATIDSGIAAWHDDFGAVRIAHFADFVNQQTTAYDDYGHGTHVAGIIAGSGYDSGGLRRGLAPGVSLVVLKAIDATGGGFTSNVIAAIDYAIAHRELFNIRVMNLSVAAGVYESCDTDPLTLAARRAVDAGIVVVAAAGNFGREQDGSVRYGGITAPGNAPWVLTVGASDDRGTPDPSDDRIASFSSRGPAAIDGAAKPDIVAPGVGIESTADPGSLLYATNATGRLWGSIVTASEPYLRLNGTSMAAPIVAGTIALMLEANPSLGPADVKAILAETATFRRGIDARAQGAGFLDVRAAIRAAAARADRGADR